MLYLPSFRRSAHQDDTPPPAYLIRPYTPEPIPSPSPLHNTDPTIDLTTTTTPHNNGMTFIPPYSSPHLSPATSKSSQTTRTRLTKNVHYALLALSLLTFLIAVTIIGLAADTLHRYRAVQSAPPHLRVLPPNLDRAPTVAVLSSAALVAILNVTFIIISTSQTIRRRPDQPTSTPLLALLTSLSTLPFALFAVTYYQLHAFTAPPFYGPALAAGPTPLVARGVPPAPVPTPSAATEDRAYAGLSSAGATGTSTASATVIGLQGWACRSGVGVAAGRICGEGRALGGLVGVLVGLCVLGVVGGGVGVWLGRRKSRARGEGDAGKGQEEGGWL